VLGLGDLVGGHAFGDIAIRNSTWIKLGGTFRRGETLSFLMPLPPRPRSSDIASIVSS